MEAFELVGAIIISLAAIVPLFALGIESLLEERRLKRERKSKETQPL